MDIGAMQSTTSIGVPQAQQPQPQQSPVGDSTAARSAGGAQDVAAALPASTPQTPEEKAKEAAQQVAQAKASAEYLDEFMKRYSIGLSFTVDDSTKQIVVKVTNKATGELIRQIPSEESLKLAKAANDLQGVIIRAKA